MVVLPFWYILALSSSFGRRQYLLKFHRTLFGLAEILVKTGRCRKEEKNHGECFRCCAITGRYMVLFCKAIFRKEWVFGRRRMGLLEKETRSGKNALWLSESCISF